MIKEEYDQDPIQLKTSKSMIGIANKLLNNNKINFDEFKKVESYLLTTSNKFSRVLMELEGYYCLKEENGTTLLKEEKQNFTPTSPFDQFYISFAKFSNLSVNYELEDLEGRNYRNNVYHFNFPKEVSYVKKLIEIEEKFIEEEIVNANIDVSSLVTFYDIPIKRIREVLTALKDTLHDDLFAKAKRV
ncbi:hypothetical protein JJC03_01015 [Flavobacterium oreochromis]|uniref:hypothetical protein n=1 Tax=Flavobacterium oreochromis TaxID=2906078 RepID=UPI001CE62B90|nr:hypothetical protein [Flavobacterium oreochromis]QYS86679.1 hypothetical protein JJC03_01015 [Flavobacterium oreochromis]